MRRSMRPFVLSWAPGHTPPARSSLSPPRITINPTGTRQGPGVRPKPQPVGHLDNSPPFGQPIAPVLDMATVPVGWHPVGTVLF